MTASSNHVLGAVGVVIGLQDLDLLRCEEMSVGCCQDGRERDPSGIRLHLKRLQPIDIRSDLPLIPIDGVPNMVSGASRIGPPGKIRHTQERVDDRHLQATTLATDTLRIGIGELFSEQRVNFERRSEFHIVATVPVIGHQEDVRNHIQLGRRIGYRFYLPEHVHANRVDRMVMPDDLIG